MTDLWQQATQQLTTPQDWIRFGITRMEQEGLWYGHGYNSALDESLALVLHALGLPYGLPDNLFAATLLAEEREAICKLLQARIEQRKPSAYLMNKAWFMDMAFYVDERVLIPRSPLAEWLRTQYSPWFPDVEAVEDIVDLCCGSGCIGIASATIFPEANVDLVDISSEALQVAQRNIDQHQLGWRVQTVQGDLLAPCQKRYDLMLTNPPYVTEQEMTELPAEYRFEPRLGLTAGHDGLAIIRRILREAPRYLKPQGLLVAEVGDTWRILANHYPEVPFVWQDFDQGGEGVFVMTTEQLQQYAHYFAKS